MLRISIVEARNEVRLVLEGKLISPWTDELRVAYEQTRRELDGRELVVSADSLTEISKEGEALLVDLMNEGARFRCCGVYTKRVFQQCARKAREQQEAEK